MRAWLVDQFGEPEQMRLGDAPAPVGGIPIRVQAAGINFFDLLQIRGGYQHKPPFPFIPGAEVSGVREDTGEHVMAICTQGGYAEHVCAPEDRVFSVPASLDFAEAAGFLIVYHTSWFVLNERARLKPGEWLLVHAGASGTGMSAIQIGRAMGARVIATASTEAKLNFCREQGAEAALSYENVKWIDHVKDITEGQGVNVVYDPVGGEAFDLSLKCLALEGRIAVVGFASGRIPNVAANRLLLRNVSVVGAIWGGYVQVHPRYVAGTHTKLETLLADGKIRPAAPRRYRFEQAPEALRDVDQRMIIGKAVLVL